VAAAALPVEGTAVLLLLLLVVVAAGP